MQIESIPAPLIAKFGKQYLLNALSFENPVGYFLGRSAGWWTANNVETYAAYRALADVLTDSYQSEPQGWGKEQYRYFRGLRDTYPYSQR